MDSQDLAVIKDIVVALSAAAVAIVAFFGLQSWRREMTGRAKFDTAKSLLLAARETSEKFHWARGPFTGQGESLGRQPGDSESAAVAQVLNEWYARSNRLEELRHSVTKVAEAGREAGIVLGETAGAEVDGAVREYRRAFGELASAVQSYFHERRETAGGIPSTAEKDWMTGLRDTVYGREDDALASRVDAASESLSKRLEKYLK